jgi:hypothetical protein
MPELKPVWAKPNLIISGLSHNEPTSSPSSTSLRPSRFWSLTRWTSRCNRMQLNVSSKSMAPHPRKFVAFLILVIVVAQASLVFTKTASAQDNLVATPDGFRSAACVHDVGNGAFVDSNGTAVFANGSKVNYSCGSPPPPSTSGRVEYAYYSPSSTINTYVGYWTVPTNPSTNHGQIIYLFTAQQDPYGDIIQPVLMWGFDGPYYEIASWYCAGLSCSHSTAYSVTPGDQIYGSLVVQGCGSRGCVYTSTITDTHTSQSSSITASGCTACQQATVTLEVYSVSVCTDYPASGGNHFYGLGMTTYSGTVYPSWSTSVLINDGCGESVSAPDSGDVYLYY